MKDLQLSREGECYNLHTHEGKPLNVQTERLENHSARLTVEVPQERYSKAREASIKTISAKINIPGFRKGKVPASMVVKYVGEAYILEEVMEHLGQEVYKEALEIAGVEPAAPGSMDDFKMEPAITFTYTVPLAPQVTLGDNYRDVRLDYVEPVTSDKDVESELRAFQREFAETVESTEPVVAGDRITTDLHSFFVPADSEAGTADTDVHEREEEPYVHRHGAILDLNDGDDEPLAPGFVAQMVGANVGETRVFRITFPESSDTLNPEVLGKTVEFVVTVQKIERVTLPAIDDALAAMVSERYGWENLGEIDGESLPEAVERLADAEQAEASEGETTDLDAEGASAAAEVTEAPASPAGRPLTLEEVRARVLETIEKRTKQEAREKFANQVLEHVITGSTVVYNEATLEAEVEDMVEDFKKRLQQNRLTLDLYLKSTGKSLDEIKSDYRAPAETRLRRALAVREFANREGINVSQDDLTQRLMTVFTDLGAESVQQLGLLNNEEFASNMINNLMSQKIEERAIAIGRGEAPDLTAPALQPEVTESSTLTESPSEQ